MSENEVGELQRALGRLEGKIDLLLDAGLERRVTSLEKWRAWSIGVFAGVSTLCVVVWKIVTR